MKISDIFIIVKICEVSVKMTKAINSAVMREKNEKLILSLINKDAKSRTEIAKRIGLTKSAMTKIMDDLIQRGIVTEQIEKSNTIGRSPVMLFLNEKAFYVVGINITRRRITVGITDLGGNIVAQDEFPICSPDIALVKIKETIDAQIEMSGIDASKIFKASVITPGPVDTEGGLVLNPPNFEQWHSLPIVDKLEELTGIDVVLANISSATAIAEKHFGAAQNTENFLALLVEIGLGSGIVIKGSLLEGPCELGHTSIKHNGIECECKNRGCLEKYASIPSILKGTNYESWQEAVDNDDEDLIYKEAEYLSAAIISANNIFKFDKIVLCGEIAYKPEKIVNFISEKTKEKTLSKQSFVVCAGTVRSKLIVAASVAINNFFE